ncbi:MAG: phosphotyrosine protein phosphatase [Eubacteriales bacterium]|nr:phosphotyrosine protein phosphatase [Eubacteriales bacterium]
MKKYDKVLFVSHSDTCRGPMAEAIMQRLVLLEDILIDSKGMIVLFPEPVNPKAADVLRMNGQELQEHMAVPFTVDDFDDRTLILTMEEAQKEKLLKDYPAQAKNLYTLLEYIGRSGDIYDPIGKDLPEYGKCFHILEAIIQEIAKVLREENQ